MEWHETMRRLSGWAGWAVLAFVGFATLSPIGLRPHFGGATVEHFGAFAAIGFFFALAYPRHALLIALLTVGAAVLLEVAQLLTLTRHARVLDALVKIVGAFSGITLAAGFDRGWRRSP